MDELKELQQKSTQGYEALLKDASTVVDEIRFQVTGRSIQDLRVRPGNWNLSFARARARRGL